MIFERPISRIRQQFEHRNYRTAEALTLGLFFLAFLTSCSSPSLAQDYPAHVDSMHESVSPPDIRGLYIFSNQYEPQHVLVEPNQEFNENQIILDQPTGWNGYVEINADNSSRPAVLSLSSGDNVIAQDQHGDAVFLEVQDKVVINESGLVNKDDQQLLLNALFSQDRNPDQNMLIIEAVDDQGSSQYVRLTQSRSGLPDLATVIPADIEEPAFVYTDNFLFSLIDQPLNDPGYVSDREDVMTSFGIVERQGNIALLAHNINRAGRAIHNMGNRFVSNPSYYVITKSGAVVEYKVDTLVQMQALNPTSTKSDFINLNDPSKAVISAASVYNDIYIEKSNKTPNGITFQTCLEYEGDLNGAREFVITFPKIELEDISR